jgi:hypothetical protein
LREGWKSANIHVGSEFIWGIPVIEHYIAECLRNPQPTDRANGEHEPPSEAEREAACRLSVLHADRLNPDNRPLKHP